MAGSAFASAIKRDRAVVVAAIAVLIALAWAYTAHVAWNSTAMAESMAMPNAMAWSSADFAFMFIMWAVMMVAMMLPSATPMIVLYGRVRETRVARGRSYAPTAAFVAGYITVWIGFSLAATALNWGLHRGGALSSMMGNTAPILGGMFLIAAGLFQWTPLKEACLNHCRSPIGFLMEHWRENAAGAMKMGLHHGAYCLGCCWMLMALLFVLGVMNLPWVAVLAVVVLGEKVLPHGVLLSRLLGAGMVVWGAWLIIITAA
jgi:predicted metal-binding membrane protein